MRKQITTILQHKFFKGSLLLTIISQLVNVLNACFIFLVGHSLGTKGYGEMAALLSYISILSIPTSVISMLVIQKIGTYKGNSYSYAYSLEQWLLAKIKQWWFVGLLFIVTYPFLPYITNLSPLAAYFMYPLFLCTLIDIFYDASLQGLHMFTWLAIATLSTVIIKLIGPILVYMGVGGLSTILFFLLVSYILKGLWSISLVHNKVKKTDKIVIDINKRIIHAFTNRQFLLTLISVGGILIYNNIDIIYTKKIFSAHQAGLYSSWALFARLILYAIGPLLSVSYVFFSSKQFVNKKETAIWISFIFFIVAGIANYIFYTHFAKQIILIVFGDKFLEVFPYLQTASICGILYTYITFMNTYFLAQSSKAAGTLALLIPIYLFLLLLFGNTIGNIININIIFAVLTSVIYFVIFITSSYITYRDDK